jgi:hypothetical protein
MECVWTYIKENEWKTSCGFDFRPKKGMLSENDINDCPHCLRKIRIFKDEHLPSDLYQYGHWTCRKCGFKFPYHHEAQITHCGKPMTPPAGMEEKRAL